MKHHSTATILTATITVLLGAATVAVAAPLAVVAVVAEVEPEPVTSYDGYKVVRLPTGVDLNKVASLVGALGLETWTMTGSFADVMVPPAQWETFHAETAGLAGSRTLYEDLGVAVASERQVLFASE